MLHKPTIRKQPKRYNEAVRPSSEQKVDKANIIQRNRQLQSNKKLSQKHPNEPTLPKIPLKSQNKTIPQKVQHLEKVVDKLSKGTGQPQMQKILLQEIQGIKSELREIKQQIGLSPGQHSHNKYQPEEEDEEVQEQEEDIANMVPREYNQSKMIQVQPKIKSEVFHEEPKMNERGSKMEYSTYDKKELLDIGKIQPYMKEFKLQNTKMLQPIYPGYHKKSSKPIVVKYCPENKSMEGQITLYERLWKNIVKAKKVCINKIYDINQPMAHNIMALEMNKYSLSQIPLPPEQILKDLLRSIQFMHQCGFLYRDLHPTHVMQNFEGNIVLVGLKRMKRFTDIKNRLVEVRGNHQQQPLHQFVSNARLRGIAQGRKDDLEALGYLALYLLEGKVPWSINGMVQGRSKVTLQQLYGKYRSFFEFMVTVHKMTTDEQPNYDHLSSLIAF